MNAHGTSVADDGSDAGRRRGESSLSTVCDHRAHMMRVGRIFFDPGQADDLTAELSTVVLDLQSSWDVAPAPSAPPVDDALSGLLEAWAMRHAELCSGVAMAEATFEAIGEALKTTDVALAESVPGVGTRPGSPHGPTSSAR